MYVLSLIKQKIKMKEQIFNTKAYYNKFLKELTDYEISVLFDMMEEYALEVWTKNLNNLAEKYDIKNVKL